MKSYGATVLRDSTITRYYGRSFSKEIGPVQVSGSGMVPIGPWRSVLTYNGVINRIQGMLEGMDIVTEGGGVKLHVIYDGTLTGSTFTEPTSSYSTFQIDTDATAVTGGEIKETILVHQNSLREISLSPFSLKRILGLNADGAPITATLAAELLNPAVTSSVTISVGWKELR